MPLQQPTNTILLVLFSGLGKAGGLRLTRCLLEVRWTREMSSLRALLSHRCKITDKEVVWLIVRFRWVSIKLGLEIWDSHCLQTDLSLEQMFHW